MNVIEKVNDMVGKFTGAKQEFITQQEILANTPNIDIREHNNQSMYGQWEQNDMAGIVGVTLDNSSLLISIESSLSGKILVTKVDPKTNKKYSEWANIGEPIMNEKGVRAVMRYLRSILDKNTIMTYIPTEEKLDETMIELSDALYLLLAENSTEFNIKWNYMHAEAKKIMEQIHLTLYRGLQGNEKKGIYKDTQTRRVESYNIPVTNQQVQNKLGGMFR